MIKIIVATSQNNVIGVGNELPWHIPAEMSHFKKETAGDNVLMGRKTWESIPEKYRPLAGRHNVVISSQKNVVKGAHEVFSSIESSLEWFDDLTVIGGSSIYQYFFENDLVDEVVLSVVDQVIADSPDNVELIGFDKDVFKNTKLEIFDGFSVFHYKKLDGKVAQ